MVMGWNEGFVELPVNPPERYDSRAAKTRYRAVALGKTRRASLIA